MTLSRIKKRRKRPAASCRILQMALGIFGTFVLSIVSGTLDSVELIHPSNMAGSPCALGFVWQCFRIVAAWQLEIKSDLCLNLVAVRSTYGPLLVFVVMDFTLYRWAKRSKISKRVPWKPWSHGAFEGILASTGCCQVVISGHIYSTKLTRAHGQLNQKQTLWRM